MTDNLTRYTHSVDEEGLPCMIEHPKGAWVLLADVANSAQPDTRELVEALGNTLDALERQRAGFPLEAEHYYAIRDGALAALRAKQGVEP